MKNSFFQRAVNWANGRHTLFAIVELAVGTALAWFHKLDMSFVALVGTIQGMVLGHSIKEDWFAAKQQPAPDQGGADNANPTS